MSARLKTKSLLLVTVIITGLHLVVSALNVPLVAYAQSAGTEVISTCLIQDKVTGKTKLSDIIGPSNTKVPLPLANTVKFNQTYTDTPANEAFRNGLKAFAENRVLLAADYFWSAIQNDPDYTMAYYNLWKMLEALYSIPNQKPKVRQFIEKVQLLTKATPQAPQPYWMLALLYSSFGTPEEARQQTDLLVKAVNLGQIGGQPFAPALLEIAKRTKNSKESLDNLHQAMLGAKGFVIPYIYYISHPPFAIGGLDKANQFIEDSKKWRESDYLFYDKTDLFAGEKIAQLISVYFVQTQLYSGPGFLDTNYGQIIKWGDILIQNYPNSYWANHARLFQAITYFFKNDFEKTLLIFSQMNSKKADWYYNQFGFMGLNIILPTLLGQNRASEALPLVYATLNQFPLDLQYSPNMIETIDAFFLILGASQSGNTEVESLIAQGYLAMQSSKYDESLDAFKAAYYKAIELKDEGGRRASAIDVAVAYMAGSGNKDTAIQAMREAVLRPPVFTPEAYQIGSAMAWEWEAFIRGATWLFRLQDYNCSFEAMEYALRQLELIPGSQINLSAANARLEIYLELAQFWMYLGNLEKAETYLEAGKKLVEGQEIFNYQRLRILNKLTEVNLIKAQLKSNLSTLNADEVQAEAKKLNLKNAVSYISQIQQMYAGQPIGPAERTEYAKALINLVYTKLYADKTDPADLDKIETYLQQAKDAFPLDTRFSLHGLERAELLEVRGDISLAYGSWDNGVGFLTNLIISTERISQSDVADLQLLAHYYYTRGLLSEKAVTSVPSLPVDKNLLQDAEADYRRAIKYLESILDSSLTNAELSQFFILNNTQVYDHLIGLLVKKGIDGQREAFELSERAKAIVTTKLWGNIRFDFEQQVDQLLLTKIRLLQGRISSKAVNPLILRENLSQAQLQELDKEKTELDTLLKQLKKDYPVYAALAGLASLTLPEIQPNLAEGVTVVSYYTTDDTIYAWLITRDDFRFYDLQQASVKLKIGDWRKDLDSDSSKESAIKMQAVNYYDILIGKFKDELKASRQLIISPHKILNYAPFNAFYDKTGQQYLIEQFSLSYTVNLTQLIAVLTRPDSGKAEGALIVTNPAGISPKLQAAEEEGQRLATIWNTNQFTGQTATLSNLLEHSSGKQIIHLATHGKLNTTSAESYLELANLNGKPVRLTLQEISKMNLAGTNLVVLSACSTITREEKFSGDEVNNLNLAFLRAGSKSVIFSLWEVDDEATAQLMEQLHIELRKNVSKVDALRQAQINLIKQGKTPHYWAAFSLLGDFKPIELQPDLTFLLPASFGLVVLAGLAIGVIVFSLRRKAAKYRTTAK